MTDATWIARLDAGDPGSRPNEMRVAVKDCIDVAGVVTTAGSPAVAATAQPAPADAACLAGIRAAGARIVGKANLHELCFGATGVNPHYGTPVNPLDPRRVPGGSSSGSAVAVATGQADIGIGTDTTGSIRNPAAYCGLVGLKTTWGVVSVVGVRPLAPTLDTVGILARTVADCAAGASLLDDRLVAGDLVASRTVGRLRIPGTDSTIDAAIDSALIEAGIEIIDVDLPGWDGAREAAMTLLYGEALLVNQDLWLNHRAELGADVVERFALAETISPAEMADARGVRDPWRAELAGVLDVVGVLALPTALAYPPRLADHRRASNPACPAISLAGHPALALPVPSGGLLPASLQLVAPDRAEPRLLATAAIIESAVA